jgi:phage gp36-like protein
MRISGKFITHNKKMFLTIDDYKPVCSPRELDILQQDDTLTRQQAEQTAQEEAAGYLRSRYDMQAAFAEQGAGRNPLLVQIVVNITIWYLVQWLPQKMASGNRLLLYKNAIEWLRDVQAGKAMPDLPGYITGDGKPADMAFPFVAGSMPKQQYDW